MTSATTRARKLVADPEVAARVLAILEAPTGEASVTCPDDIVDHVRPFLAGREAEALVCVAFDRRRRVIDVAVITTGSSGYCIVDPAQILRWLFTRKRLPASFAIAHNHPSGDPTPSPQDREVTTRVATAGRAVGIPLVDHIVVCDTTYRSLARDGLLPDY